MTTTLECMCSSLPCHWSLKRKNTALYELKPIYQLQSWPKLGGTRTKSYMLEKLHSIFSNSGESSRSRLPPPSPQNNVDLLVGRTDLNLHAPNLPQRWQKFFVNQHCTGGGGEGGSVEKMCGNLRIVPTILAGIV